MTFLYAEVSNFSMTSEQWVPALGTREIDISTSTPAAATVVEQPREAANGSSSDLKRLDLAHRSLEGAVRNYDKAGDSFDRKARRSEAFALKNRIATILADLGGS